MGEAVLTTVVSIIVLVTACLVAVDASNLGARRGALGGGFLDMGPAGWFFACLLLWIVAFPSYLAARPRLVRRAKALPTASVLPMATNAGAYPAWSATRADFIDPNTAPPGWYPNPSPGFGGPSHLWWDGRNWTAAS